MRTLDGIASLAILLACFSSAQTISPGAPISSRPSSITTEEPKSAADWFRRADELTNIRMPGSLPFHMKVSFHAYPGMDFTEPGKSPIMTGDGTYEEWWYSPRQWRREVTFGSYHAVEVQDGVRKFQATSEYEPSRVLMLLRALLYPIPRYLIEPELQDNPGDSHSAIANKKLPWKVKHLSAGKLDYVELSYRVDDGKCIDMAAYDLLPSAVPVRLTDRMGLTTAWEKQTSFGGKAVSQHLTVTAMGRDLVSADIEIRSATPGDSSLAQLAGEQAAACMTLRPFDQWDFPPLSPVRSDVPRLPPGAVYPAGIEIVTAGVVDRQGMPREAETTGVQQDPSWLSNDEKQAILMHARLMVQSWYRNRYHPVLLDGSPCEVLARTSLLSGHPTFSGVAR
ncbi:MAG TPA: hypothetical protein VJU82_09050 [Acidobacteriaceae bacterium]|nr:hypothetical protein [Acidobacteriaceae bacterium]